MASHRPYRPGLGLDLALKEIRAEAGIQLDKTIVDAVCALHDEGDVLQKIIGSL
jgi:HD-GYP domain-containing protein (c-di-GMP phosphodiesterase class II)